MKLLITGATGNVGLAIAERVSRAPGGLLPVAGVRDIDRAKATFPVLADMECRRFDFENPETFAGALTGMDAVFILRPPHITDIDSVFAPLLQAIKVHGIRKVSFLSVQGAERSAAIPHRKIELLILDSGLDYIFLRPSYFMQNLTTTLLPEIRARGSVTLPAGKGLFNWVDVDDIADVASETLDRFEEFRNRALVISGTENAGFHEVINRINGACGTVLRYRSRGPLGYFLRKREEGMVLPMVLVTFILHFLPRIQGAPEIADTVQAVLGREPHSLGEFIERNKELFTGAQSTT